jgi:dihydrolipoamide dehydrogenase
MADKDFDLIVIGGGPGGYVAAIRGAQLGMKTAVVEREHLGGICLNWGCIPTKALLRSSEVWHVLQNLKDYGLKADNLEFDLQAIVERSRGVAKQLSGGIGHLLKKNKIEVVMGEAKLAGNGQVKVSGVGTLSGKHIILAVGARARSLPGLEADGDRVWTYREAMVPKEVPKSLLVVGSGAIGIEFASFYNDLGASVTVVEVMDRILPVEDEEISSMALKAFEKQGIKVLTGAKVADLKRKKGRVTAIVEVDVDRGHIVINEWCETDEPGVYAIGDVAGAPWLAHKASHEGVICVEKIAGVQGVHPLNKSLIPGCTYSRPQIASVGMTEKAAKEAGHDVKVGKFPFLGNGKAIALGEPEGMVKTLFDVKTGELLGAHMIGAEVTELIQGYVVARTLETTEAELMHTVFPHPTLSEMMHESVLDAYGRAIHF